MPTNKYIDQHDDYKSSLNIIQPDFLPYIQ